jgi:DnaJ family protein A protein 2
MTDVNTLARTYFGVTLPVPSVRLKRAYHQQCLKLHPDRGGDEQEFKEMQAAYATITSGPLSAVFDDPEYTEPVTIDGVPLAQLGLGLPGNGYECPACAHKGYLPRVQRDPVPCQHCSGYGAEPFQRQFKCVTCCGTGKKGEVTCRYCHGSGVLNDRNPLWPGTCRRCHGAGVVPGAEKLVYIRCFKCNGHGELPTWNPVLQKTAVAGKKGHIGRK